MCPARSAGQVGATTTRPVMPEPELAAEAEQPDVSITTEVSASNEPYLRTIGS